MGDVTQDQRALLDWFIIDYWKVLPTDEKFHDLEEFTKEWMFLMFRKFPDLAEVRHKLMEKLYNAQPVPKFDENMTNDLKEWGIYDAVISDLQGLEKKGEVNLAWK